MGLGERCKLPQRGPGWSPGRKRIWCTLKLSESHWGQSFSIFWSGYSTKLDLGWGGDGVLLAAEGCSDTPSPLPAYALAVQSMQKQRLQKGTISKLIYLAQTAKWPSGQVVKWSSGQVVNTTQCSTVEYFPVTCSGVAYMYCSADTVKATLLFEVVRLSV